MNTYYDKEELLKFIEELLDDGSIGEIKINTETEDVYYVQYADLNLKY